MAWFGTARRWAAAAVTAAMLVGCGGGGTTTVGGTVTGLPAGMSVSLQNEGRHTLVVGANGSFTFDEEFVEGERYDVTIAVQPAAGLCTVSNGRGRIDGDLTPVTDIAVVCTAAYSIGGTVSGLAEEDDSVTLLNNDGDSLVVSNNGFFVFPSLLTAGAAYEVTVSEQPSGKTCSVSRGTGTVPDGNVSNVAVSCN
jgi:hypothetical protein